MKKRTATKVRRSFRRLLLQRRLVAGCAIVLFALVGAFVLLRGRAAVPTLSLEPESHTVTGSAAVGNDSAASNGKYVQFNAPPGAGTVLARAALGMNINSKKTVDEIEQWLGGSIKYGVVFPGVTTPGGGVWDLMDPSRKNLAAYKDRITYIFSIAPVTTNGSIVAGVNGKTVANRRNVAAEFQKTISGQNDSKFQAFANRLVQYGIADKAIVRLGWEFNGDWFTWSAYTPDSDLTLSPPINNCENFRNAFRRVVTVVKAIAPQVRFDYTAATSIHTGANNGKDIVSCAYPGDAYVDIIGGDFYDRGAAARYFDPSKPGWINPLQVWNEVQKPKIQRIRDFAVSKGKPLSIPEWGLEGSAADGGIEGNHNPGGDNPTFIQQLYDWMNEIPAGQPGGILYHAYFWETVNNEGPHKLNDPSLKNAADRFRLLYK